MTISQRTSSRRAFTLVEMVVTVGVIVILTALTVSATVALSRKSDVTQTENTVRLLDMALSEWETQMDRKLTWGVRGVPYAQSNYDVSDGTPHIFSLSEVLRPIRRADAVKSVMAQIKPEFIYVYNSNNPDLPVPQWLPETPDPDEPDPFVQGGSNPRSVYLDGGADGEFAVLDAWGVPIRAVHPGRSHDPSRFTFNDPQNLRDLDGTLRLTRAYTQGGFEEIYGVCENRRVRFVSAGPDGKFGDLGADHETEIHQQAHDNICSYDPEDDHG
jgi:prepilin-type N-terminal cleavage/methylation domain-containing protein